MLFNTLEFAVFLPIVFAIFWLLKNKLKLQNLFLVAASYFFYGWWDWRFLTLIVFSSTVDYILAIKITDHSSPKTKKMLVTLSLIINLGLLGFFKYFNFFTQSFAEAFTFFGFQVTASSLNIILPVGISFYTFQTLSYTIDVYRGNIKHSKDPVGFFAYVSFFPQLVAGPIERASNLLPQFKTNKVFNYNESILGLKQIIWGLFKKVVVADTCAYYVNQIFDSPTQMPTLYLALGVVFFAFQIYGDFSGYSDIAIGTSRLFGFNLMRNFNFPYFSRDIAEFWRRWHISLSTWFRDYLYIPLGGSRGGTWQKVKNTFIIFVVSGFWHGANMTFVFWGFLNALFFLPLLLTNRNRKNLDIVAKKSKTASLTDFIKICWTFLLVCYAWIFFRADSITAAFEYQLAFFTQGWSSNLNQLFILLPLAIIGFLVLIEWNARHSDVFYLPFKNKAIRVGVYATFAVAVFIFGGVAQKSFVYFQF